MFFEEDVIDIRGLQIGQFIPDVQIMAEIIGQRQDIVIPTHTEDSIPIRKLYVANLPQKTCRSDLFSVFAQYGFIKSCWIRLSEPRGLNGVSSPTYAFVTYSNPEDAHKALKAPYHEKYLRGRHLKVCPADSWHQPIEDCNGKMRWNQHSTNLHPINNQSNSDDCNSETNEAETSEGAGNSSTAVNDGATEGMESQEQTENEPIYTITDVLNRDCLHNILSYVSIIDLIRSERVSKAWQSMVQEYIESIRMYKTSWWHHKKRTLTTAVLRRLLARLGGSLTQLHIDHSWLVLNDRTAHSIGKFCPNLEELFVTGMQTKNWNPLIYGCRKLKSLSFVLCDKITDASLTYIVKDCSLLEHLSINSNMLVTGLFLTGSNPKKLQSLCFKNCLKLQKSSLIAAIETINYLTTLKLESCSSSVWKAVPYMLKKLPNLENLSLSNYVPGDNYAPHTVEDELLEAFATLVKLRELNLSWNMYIKDSHLKVISQHCSELRSLDVACCNSRRSGGVSDEGVAAVCLGCPMLDSVDVSYLTRLTDAGVRAIATARNLVKLTARGHSSIATPPFAHCLHQCHNLQILDVRECGLVSDELVAAASVALESHPRPLWLHLATTPVTPESLKDFPPFHKFLRVDFESNQYQFYLHPDSDGSDDYDDIYDDLYDDVNDDHDDDFGFGSDEDEFDVMGFDDFGELLNQDYVFL